MPTLPTVQERGQAAELRIPEVVPGPGRFVAKGLGTLADAMQEAADQQDSLDLKFQGAQLDTRLEALKDEIKDEPNFAKRGALYEQKAKEYLDQTSANISSRRVQQGLKQYYEQKFPNEALKVNRDIQKDWGNARVAQTDQLADVLAEKITTIEPSPPPTTYEGRPVVRNPDGSLSHERSISIEADGKYMNIPTMFGGKSVSPDEAVEIVRKNNWIDPDTGKKIPTFASQEEAVKAAEAKELKQQSIGRENPEVKKYMAIYSSQLEQLSTGRFPAITPTQRVNMEQAFGIKVLDRRAKRLIADSGSGFLVAADEGQFDGLPDLEKYRTMARGKQEDDERRNEKVRKEVSEIINDSWNIKANNGTISPSEMQSLLNGESQYISPQEARRLNEVNSNPPVGGGSTAVKTIASEYYLSPRTLPHINATRAKLRALQAQMGQPDPAINKLANELQSDQTAMENQAISRDANEIQRQNREIGTLQNEYDADRAPTLKALENLFGNQDKANRAKIEAEYRRSGYEAAKKLKETLAKGQKTTVDTGAEKHNKALNY